MDLLIVHIVEKDSFKKGIGQLCMQEKFGKFSPAFTCKYLYGHKYVRMANRCSNPSKYNCFTSN